MIMRNRIRPLAALAALVIVASTSTAQMADEILQRASGALIEAGTLRAKLSIHGEGADMFKSAMPVGEVAFLLRHEKPSEDEDAGGWTTRITGQTTTGSADKKKPVEIDLVRTPKFVRWVDKEQKKVYQTAPERAISMRSPAYSAARSLLLTELLTPVPLSKEMEAEEFAVLDTAEVDGIVCDVVEITYPKQTGRLRSGRTHQVARISIGKDDHLPRRIERVSGSGAFSMVIVLELTDLEPGAELEESDFEIPVPEGFALAKHDVTNRASVSVNRANVQKADGSPQAASIDRKPAEPEEVFPPAPEFSAQLADGSELTLESLKGRAGVLYFWGTWSMECRKYSPLVSEMADDYRDRGVRFVGLAVRERDPSNAVSVALVRDYTFEVATGDTSVTDAFGVVVYPTFVVLDAGGHLIGTERVRPDAQPDDVLGKVRTLIDKAVKIGSPGPEDDPELTEDDSPQP